MRRRACLAAAIGLGLVGGVAQAQDSQFGIRGLGAPGSFSSVRAWSTGGAFAPFDGISPLTDAALSDVIRLTAAATEFSSYRSVDDGANSSSLRSSRFPMLTVAGPVTNRLLIGGGFSTYLYRSYNVVVPGSVSIRGQPESYEDQISSDGAVTDLRLAAAWRFSPSLAVGAGFHILTGSSQLAATRLFADSTLYRNAVQVDQESYGGLGASFSILARPLPGLRLSGFVRSDSRLRVEVQGFPSATSDLPTTVGGGLQWIVTPEVALAGTIQHANWSVSGGSGGGAFNTTNWAFGGQFGRPALPIRVGVRGGEMPFGPGPDAPRELGISAGTGFTFAAGRGIIDLGLEHLRRTGGGLTENDWTFLVGLTVRP